MEDHVRVRTQSECLWVISDDAQLCEKILAALDEQTCVRILPREVVEESTYWRKSLTLPGAVLLDLDDDLDWAAGVLRDIKRAHIRAPVIVVSRELSKEFGIKIVSEGVSYFMLREFDPEELREVARVLIKPAQRSSK